MTDTATSETAMPESVRITRPDDFHLHIRDADIMDVVLPYTARVFARAIIMPNLSPPITDSAMAQAYRERIKTSLNKSLPQTEFEPLMTAYLTDNSNPKDIINGYEKGILTAVKMYPAGATTHSQFGLSDFFKPHALYEAMAEAGMPLLIHGELISPDIDIYDREKLFINNILKKIIDIYPKLKIVLEHITTRDSIDFIKQCDSENIAATITPHHLLINRSDMFGGSRLRPHLFCLPVAKRETHRQALIQAAISGDKRFFAGTDSAPHAKHEKESACGCAGIFNAPSALQCYAEIFDAHNAIDKLNNFTSRFGADFYGLPYNEGTLTLHRQETPMRDTITTLGGETIIPFRNGDTMLWDLALWDLANE